MAWINLTFFAEENDIDLLSEELESSGALSIFIQDKNLNNSNEEITTWRFCLNRFYRLYE